MPVLGPLCLYLELGAVWSIFLKVTVNRWLSLQTRKWMLIYLIIQIFLLN